MKTITLFEKTLDLLESTKTNFTVEKRQLFSLATDTDAAQRATESFGLFRTDTNKWLGTVGKQYTPFQNSVLAETLHLASEKVGLNFTRGGELNGGKKIYYQAEMKPDYIGNSEVKRYITALNSHDGTTCIGFGSSSTVVICQNTFFRAMKEVNKFRHSADAQQRIENAIKDMNSAIFGDNEIMKRFHRMAETPFSMPAFNAVMQTLFDVTSETDMSKVSTRKKNQIEAFSRDLNTEIQDEGKTVWGLFNAVTRYLNHTATLPEEKENFLLAGGGQRLSNLCFDELLKQIERNEVKEELVSSFKKISIN